MKLAELLNETTDQADVLNDIEEFVVRAKARGFTKFKTSALLARLQSAGYALDQKSLVKMLNTIQSVGSANKEFVTLDTAIPDTTGADDDQTVSNLAAKQLARKDRKL